MSPTDISFYQNHLNSVSRSFSFCIEALDEPLRRWVSSSYLICRVLDTIEDSIWPSKQDQKLAFNQFHDFFEKDSTDRKIKAWVESFPESTIDAEKKLLLDMNIILSDFSKFPRDVQVVIQEMVFCMSRGMQHYSNNQTQFRLKSLSEVNRYCFFVAGIVGEILAKLIAKSDPNIVVTENFLDDAHHFGLFLQKVNLLKDQAGDEKQNRFLVPNRAELKFSLIENAEKAFSFLEAIPESQSGFRKFCAWSLFLGLGSLPWMELAFEEGIVGKIPKQEAGVLIDYISENANNAESLKLLFESYLEEYRKEFVDPAAAQETLIDGSWIHNAYPGTADFSSLGMKI